MYVSAPVELTRQEAFSYHVGTRNYFAFLLNKPIVGESFGLALTHLWTRIQTWQLKSSPVDAFREYCQEQGYLNFAGNLEYAAAALYWSEQARMKDVWIDAFVHCVGMHDQPDRDERTRILSSSARGLLHKASLEMHLNVSRATRSLGTFLEEELGPEHLGLFKQLRDHLDRFRSSLHSFYVQEFGYFPPGPREPWDKRMWVRIYNDFHCLYKYLADTTSSTGMTNNYGLNGGICVIQNVKAFDENHGFSSLKHPLPLLPESPARRRTIDARRSLGSFSRPRVPEPDFLSQATNSNSRRVMTNAFVQAYISFERQKLVEKVTATEARKVRWLLVYGVLQMLISVTRAPREVRDTETPSYPLCVSTDDSPPWAEDVRDDATVDQVAARISAELDIVSRTIANSNKISIQPDCEAKTAEDYFSSGSSSRRDSQMSLSMTPLPLRPLPPSRTSSIRSGVSSIRRSMVGSLTRRNSLMSSSAITSPVLASTPIAKPAAYREILIEGYGNGADVSSFSPTYPREMKLNPSGLQMHQLNTLLENSSDESTQYVSPSTTHSSSGWSRRSGGSTASSSLSECPESPATELSYAESMAPKTSSPAEEFEAFDFGLQQEESRPTTAMQIIPPPRTSSKMAFGGSETTLKPIVKERQMSSDSVASSVYPEKSLQAADIEVEDVRGRRRLKGMERMRWVGAA